MPKSNLIDQIPRWALVIISMYGIYLLQQKFDLLESTVRSHEKELRELQVITTKLTVLVERKDRQYDNQN